MAANPYPSLGWNPVPGLPESVTGPYTKVKAAADTLNNCHRRIDYLLGASPAGRGTPPAHSATRSTATSNWL